MIIPARNNRINIYYRSYGDAFYALFQDFDMESIKYR